MSDLYDGGQSRLRIAHKHLVERDALYRISLTVAPLALVVALATSGASLLWSSSTAPLPPAAVPSPPQAARVPIAPPAPSPATADLEALRKRAVSDPSAFADLRRRADAGDAVAEFMLGTLYDSNVPSVDFAHFPSNEAEAARWYLKAAGQGNAKAQYNIGCLYYAGLGVAQDYGEAMRWFREAANQGLATAQYRIGSMYMAGDGVPPDATEAMRWYRKAADQGDANALYVVGIFYAVGTDMKQAEIWMRKAAEAGSDDAKKWLAANSEPRTPDARPGAAARGFKARTAR